MTKSHPLTEPEKQPKWGIPEGEGPYPAKYLRIQRAKRAQLAEGQARIEADQGPRRKWLRRTIAGLALTATLSMPVLAAHAEKVNAFFGKGDNSGQDEGRGDQSGDDESGVPVLSWVADGVEQVADDANNSFNENVGEPVIGWMQDRLFGDEIQDPVAPEPRPEGVAVVGSDGSFQGVVTQGDLYKTPPSTAPDSNPNTSAE